MHATQLGLVSSCCRGGVINQSSNVLEPCLEQGEGNAVLCGGTMRLQLMAAEHYCKTWLSVPDSQHACT